jgi:hypothetical protein
VLGLEAPAVSFSRAEDAPGTLPATGAGEPPPTAACGAGAATFAFMLSSCGSC